MALAGLAGVIYVIYMVASGSGSINQVLALAMALSNTYGVLLITVLMGSGLVGVPKRLWLMADPQQEIQRLYLSVRDLQYIFRTIYIDS